MERALILLLITAVVLAGCLDTGGGERPDEEQPKVIQVSGPTCTVGGSQCTGQDLTKYDGPAIVTAEFRNQGDQPATVELGEQGSSVMTASCNSELVTIDPFEATVTGPSGRQEVPSGQESVELQADEVLQLQWTLDIVPDDDSNVSTLGYSCPMSFEFRFDQDITTSKQIQVKSAESVPDAGSLASDTSSESPVRLRIDAPDTIVANPARTLVVEGYLENVGRGEITEVSALTAREITCRNPDTVIRMYSQGPRSGESYRRVCTQELSIDSGSRVEDLVYETTYSYRMPLGDVQLTLVPVGN